MKSGIQAFKIRITKAQGRQTITNQSPCYATVQRSQNVAAYGDRKPLSICDNDRQDPTNKIQPILIQFNPWRILFDAWESLN